MKFRYQDQSVSIRYRNPFTHAEHELIWETGHGYKARLDRERDARAAEYRQQARERDLAQAHTAWHQMRADGVNVDTRQLDGSYAQMLARTHAEAWVAERTGQQAQREAAVPDADVQWSIYHNGEGRTEIWPSSADGNWRDKVIVADTFADPQAEADEPDIEPTI